MPMKLTHTLHMIDLASCQKFRQLKPVVILASFEAVQLKLQLVLCHYISETPVEEVLGPPPFCTLPFPPGAVPGVEILCILAPLDTVPFDTTSSSVGGKCVKCSIRTSCVAVEKENVVREDSSFECCFTTLETVIYR